MAKGYAEGPAAEEAERRRDELERRRGRAEPVQRLAVYGATEGEPEPHFIAWRDGLPVRIMGACVTRRMAPTIA